jgi:hypothetical protein
VDRRAPRSNRLNAGLKDPAVSVGLFIFYFVAIDPAF